MLAPEHAIPDLPLPTVDLRAQARRLAVPLLIAAAVVGVVLLAGGRVNPFVDGLRRGLGISPVWIAIGVLFEGASLAGYIGLLSLVAGQATPRVGTRESAQITLAGAAATRLVPTAGAGGLALTLWALRRAGLKSAAATRTLLAFLVVLYSVFLASIVLAAAVLIFGLVDSRGPVELSAVPAVAAAVAIMACLVLASPRRFALGARALAATVLPARLARVGAGARLLGDAVRDALALVRAGDPRLAGAIAYWAFDAAVLWAMLQAFGQAPVVPVVVLAYFVGQVANTVPIPGSVSGGMTGVLVTFGIPPELAIASVLAYRALSVWLPSPVALAAVPALRATVARWARDGLRVQPPSAAFQMAVPHEPRLGRSRRRRPVELRSRLSPLMLDVADRAVGANERALESQQLGIRHLRGERDDPETSPR